MEIWAAENWEALDEELSDEALGEAFASLGF
ncbi:MAG: hypothetical protein IIX18_02915 [Clostridia bacterium]|nr:hypothetical protein [Clostridia bacterium]